MDPSARFRVEGSFLVKLLANLSDPPSILSAMNPSTRSAVRRMTRRGRNPRQIAAKLGISTQAVYFHLGRLRADGELPAQDGVGTGSKRFSTPPDEATA